MSAAAQDAIAPDASAWVGANAGAGKTYILVSRLVRLMLSGVLPEKLLCLTYTRSAAAEMQERLFELLGEWALLDDAALRRAIGDRLGADVVPDDLALARVLFARALETPGGLRVQTIHAFCESLLKRFPLEAGLSPQFDLMDEQDMQELHGELIARLMRHRRDEKLGDAMNRLSRALSEPDLLRLGRLVLDRRMAFDGLDGEAHLKRLAIHSGLAVGRGDVPSAASLVATFHTALRPHAAALGAWLANGSVTDQGRSADLLAWHEQAGTQKPDMAAPRLWALSEKIFLTQDGQRLKSLATKASRSAQPELAARLDELGDAAQACMQKKRALQSYELTAAMLVFADALMRDYAAAKAARAVLDYDDLIATTNALLDGHRAAQWVLFKIDSGLEHILVDEAQDTSPAQWRLIRALADEFFAGGAVYETPRTLFAVGDEKQSIFSFQGADPSEFDKQRRHFEAAVEAVGGQFHYVPLTLSWRSTPQVLDLVDALFAEAAARQGVSLTPVRHGAHRAKAVGHVELWPLEKTEKTKAQIDLWDVPDRQGEEDGPTRLAAQIGDKISDLLSDDSQNVTAGDILILVRKRDGFVDEMIRALKRRAIDVAGADRMVLLDQMVVMDILAAADFALNSDDDLTLACVLKSPLCGVDEERLFALSHARPGTLWQSVQSAVRAEAEADKALEKAHDRLVWMRRHIDYLSPFDWLSQLLSAEGGHADLRAQLGAEIDDPVAELLRLALAYETRHVASMQGFLQWLRHGKQEIKRDMEGRGAAVRIMTVHGAKGLEAPIVFLPDTCRSAVKTGGGVEALQFDDDGRPVWRAGKVQRDAYGAARAEAAALLAAEEEKRLLYVALTRARDRLYIGGYLGRGAKKLPENCWYDRLARAFEADPESQAPMIWPGSEARPLEKKADEREDEGEGGRDKADKTAAAAFPDWMDTPPPPARITDFWGSRLYSPSGLVEDAGADFAPLSAAKEQASQTAAQTAAARGRLVHKLFEVLPDLPADICEQAGSAFLARQDDLSAQEAAALMRDVLDMMARADLADVFSPAARAEASIAGLLSLDNGQKLALSGQIDRFVETADEIVLVDFKTGTRPDKTPHAYLVQMAAYQALMREARPQKPVRCGLVWTQTGAIDWLAGDALSAALEGLLAKGHKDA